MISFNDYAISILGKQRWNELVKKYKLCTKKWTLGRTKDFYKQVDFEIRKKIKSEADIKKHNKLLTILKKAFKRRWQ